MTARVLSVGEAVFDIVIGPDSTSEHIGGSMLNVAVGLATLGQPVSLCSWWAHDPHGEVLAQYARQAGVEITPGTETATSTPVAHARLDADGVASYEFDLTWAVPLPPEPSRFGHLHTGSFAVTLEPGGSTVLELARRMRHHGTVSYDANIRPALMKTPAVVRDRVEAMVRAADLAKASEEDLDWLYPGSTISEVMHTWAKTGPALVVITRGPQGVSALLAGHPEIVHLPQRPVAVVDTVGAGDSFMAGLLSGLLDSELLGSVSARSRLCGADWSQVRPALQRGLLTSALTVGHSGSYAPSLDEVAATAR
ncbi:ribokinase [Mycolicibacterium insubricum]|uniref:Carbohydrate kinase n=1 Tax=Mycolicibacterium insubricum TaxID=444597 RepID=A0A1X0CNB4_9MYCO|nr:carbohydrate kinase [Mycolicibacterium insubricum]MCB9439499.1 carbohydrate kinase [Mycolicibacterium sp.]MCV7082670.1 carbohydrate kinase [Mycolicibacterium insubricum]ORA61489.1 carbohydrate kinase [Mycolicibacterium insubricum]BBZ65218.1 ribokinase [Mycolicibacterium insubricum]